MKHGIGPALVAGLVSILLPVAAACAGATPSEPDQLFAGSAAPTITRPVCGATLAWPDAPLALGWQPVINSANYRVELDCLGCGQGREPWFSQSGKPWLLTPPLATTTYIVDINATLRREGGRDLRWRVWAVDRADTATQKTDWCVIAFSDSGLPTPGAQNRKPPGEQ